jgi:hypothetical protein
VCERVGCVVGWWMRHSSYSFHPPPLSRLGPKVQSVLAVQFQSISCAWERYCFFENLCSFLIKIVRHIILVISVGIRVKGLF